MEIAVSPAAAWRLGTRLPSGPRRFRLFGLNPIDDAAACRRAAAAFHLVDFVGEPVIHGQFFAALDGALTHIEDVSVADDGEQIGIATVVDDLGATAAKRAVEGPVIIQREKIGDGSGAAAFGLPAGVFTHVDGADLHEAAPARSMNRVLFSATLGYYLDQMLSPLVPRAPADVIEPAPVVEIQCIVADGPAWKTEPPELAMNQPWLSAR